MPALRSCGHKKWTVASDDFFGPTQTAVILRLFVLAMLFAFVFTLFTIPQDCPVFPISFPICIILLFVLQLLVAVNEAAMLVMSLRGTIMVTKPRRHITKLLYLRIIVFFFEVGAMVYISIVVFDQDPIETCMPSSAKFLKSIVILLWIIISIYMIGFLIFSDPLGCFSNSFREGFNEAMAEDGGTLTRHQPAMHHAKRLRRDKSVHRNRVEAKRASQKIRRLCKLCNIRAASANSFDDMARLLFKLFGNVDLVLSDVLAAIILMAREQNRQMERGECIVAPLRNYTMDHLPVSMKGEHYEYKPPVVVDLNIKTNRVIMLEFLYYMEFYAFSAYGWPQHVYAHPCCGFCQLASATCCKCRYRCCSDEVANYDVVNDSLCMCGRATIDLHYNAPHSEFVYATYENDLSQVPFYVSRDHLKRTVVIAVRGTLSISDILTDVNSIMRSVEIPGYDDIVYVHKGLHETATWLVQELEKHNILEKAFKNYEEYRLVVTGHSLGAGVASVVAALLRQSYPDLICYCLSPQGCAMSYNFAEFTKKFVYSCVVGDDVVARFNLRSFMYIRKKILCLLKNCKQHKVQVFLNRRFACGGQTTDDTCEAPFEEIINKKNELDNELFTEHTTMPRWKRLITRKTIIERAAFEMQLHDSELLPSTPSFIPGNVINIRIKKSSAPWLLKKCFSDHVESIQQRANEDMCALRISTTALDDHLPENVLKALRLVVEECIYPHYPERLNELHELPIVDNTRGCYTLEATLDSVIKEREIKLELEESTYADVHV